MAGQQIKFLFEIKALKKRFMELEIKKENLV